MFGVRATHVCGDGGICQESDFPAQIAHLTTVEDPAVGQADNDRCHRRGPKSEEELGA